ncbi:MAG: hypothetical protein JXO72_05610 [Vicinamibacteria bacterium]|nr:hypothetical protein [Vicinamibacteria bacterium]
MLKPRTISWALFALFSVYLAGCGSDPCPVCPVCVISTPAPTPIPTPTPIPYVPPKPGTAFCTETTPLFDDIVFAAIDQAQQAHPEWFDSETVAGWTIALRPGSFMQFVIDKINAQPPHRADYGWFHPWALISVKNSNDFSEDYHLLTSFNAVRRFYGQTCRPATF